MARKAAKIYLPLDVGFMDDDKIVEAGEQAGWLYLAMALKCKALGTDGLIKEAQVARLNIPDWETRLPSLLATRAVHKRKAGYFLPGYLNWNDSQKEREEKLKRDRERKRNQDKNPNEGDPE